MKELNQKQRTRINQLIRKECANLTTDGDCLCLGDKCPQLNSFYHLYCNYFRKAILPLDKELSVELAEDPKTLKTCKCCGKAFMPTKKKQRYCDRCRDKKHKESARESQAKKRAESKPK